MEELNVRETRQIIGSDSYDDNFNLVRYTSELRDIETNRFFAFIDFEGDEGKIRYCEHCEEYGFKNKLGPKILKDGEEKKPDYDQWLSCYECGNTYPIHSAKIESKIKDFVQTTDNPFEDNESMFLSTDSNKERRRKGKHKSRFKVGEHEDPEIQREIDRHGSDNVKNVQ